MLFKIAGVMGVLWLLGMMYGFRLGGAIYILLAGAVVMVVLGFRKWWRRPA
jgi:hypothetical protein